MEVVDSAVYLHETSNFTPYLDLEIFWISGTCLNLYNNGSKISQNV